MKHILHLQQSKKKVSFLLPEQKAKHIAAAVLVVKISKLNGSALSLLFIWHSAFRLWCSLSYLSLNYDGLFGVTVMDGSSHSSHHLSRSILSGFCSIITKSWCCYSHFSFLLPSSYAVMQWEETQSLHQTFGPGWRSQPTSLLSSISLSQILGTGRNLMPPHKQQFSGSSPSQVCSGCFALPGSWRLSHR